MFVNKLLRCSTGAPEVRAESDFPLNARSLVGAISGLASWTLLHLHVLDKVLIKFTIGITVSSFSLWQCHANTDLILNDTDTDDLNGDTDLRKQWTMTSLL